MTALVIKNISKKHHQKLTVNQVSLEVNGGEIVGLLGPNGAGKTTCFNMIIGIIRCDSGKIFLNKKDITAYPIHLRARLGLGYLPQEASIFRELTVFENIFAILEQQKLDQPTRLKHVDILLKHFHLTHLSKQKAKMLSGGERRRLEVARALAASPRFILLDEPFANVDPVSVNELQKMIIKLSQQGIGILITDHHVRETLNICHHSYILNQGTVIASGTANQILENTEVRNVYLGQNFRF